MTRRQPGAPGGDLRPPADDDITEVLERIRTADYDGTAMFTGASGAGLHPAAVYGPLTGWREAEPYPDTEPIARYQPPAPPRPRDVLPPVPVHPGHDIIGRATAQGWARLHEVRCAYPAAASSTPIPCGTVHRDPAALSFRALRASAFAAGWHLDALGRMACPDCCQRNGLEYRTLYPVILHDRDAAAAASAGDRQAESRLRAEAEHDLFRSVLDARARHAGGPR